MKLLVILVALLLCSAPAQAQTVKALSYGTNGRFITGTNALTFSNQISFAEGDFEITDGGMIRWAGSDRIEVETYTLYGGWNFTTPAAVRTNLGLPLAALTNTNVATFRAALGLEITNGYSVNFAGGLWDDSASEEGLLVEDNEIRVGAATANTNAPTNTTNAVRWINVIAGTNTYKLPLYQ